MPDYIIHFKKPRGRTMKHIMIWAARNEITASKRSKRSPTVQGWMAEGFREYGITKLPIKPERKVPS